ncbi:DUF4232 domain-containing protein [Embleya sp. NPDC127516]|uniref:DUF4232 domain-containing protein n=1 Tax=Embleya sp. NPDC127516 TaxID=3363990 RepID=UPI00380C805C
MSVRRRPLILSTALVAGAVLSLAACGSDGASSPAAGGSVSSPPTGAPAAQPDSLTSGQPAAAPTSSTSASSRPSAPAGATSGANNKPGGGADDAYAYTHPCDKQKLSIRVTPRPGATGQRVIEVRNTGTTACGLSHYPLVYLDTAKSSDRTASVKPLIPGGLGGAPAYPLSVGQTAYAVIDLNPEGASTSATRVDELNVLADPEHMANADTLNFPLGSATPVLKPKLGLYRSTVTDAVTSMTAADTPTTS